MFFFLTLFHLQAALQLILYRTCHMLWDIVPQKLPNMRAWQQCVGFREMFFFRRNLEACMSGFIMHLQLAN